MIMSININDYYKIAADLNFKISSNGHLEVIYEDGEIQCGIHGLKILDCFSKYTRIAEAHTLLKVNRLGKQDWIEMTSTIYRMIESNILIQKNQPLLSHVKSVYGYDNALVHTLMLNDTQRTHLFLNAIRAQVKPGDVVIDIGTGTGILAIAAAQAGAKKVYAIEASSIGKTAIEMFAANGFSDVIELVEGWSTSVELSEKANVLVSEMVGNDPFGEQIFEITTDACERLLTPNATLIPYAIRGYVKVLKIPEDELNKKCFSEANINRWEDNYAINFEPLSKLNDNHSQVYFKHPSKIKNWLQPDAPLLLGHYNLSDPIAQRFSHQASFKAAHSYTADGCILFFEIDLGNNIILSTEPSHCPIDNHWHSPLWILANPIEIIKNNHYLVKNRRENPSNLGELSIQSVSSELYNSKNQPQ